VDMSGSPLPFLSSHIVLRKFQMGFIIHKAIGFRLNEAVPGIFSDDLKAIKILRIILHRCATTIKMYTIQNIMFKI